LAAPNNSSPKLNRAVGWLCLTTAALLLLVHSCFKAIAKPLLKLKTKSSEYIYNSYKNR
jgi:hypothetical protein